MFTERSKDFLAVAGQIENLEPATMAGAMLVVDPDFAVCADTGADNRYLQVDSPADPGLALKQQHEVADKLRSLGLPVVTFPPLSGASDGVFPNNAFAPYRGKLIVGAMRHPVRQLETGREDIRDFFRHCGGYEVVDLSKLGVTAELTGTLIIDHARRLGFCGLSERADRIGARTMHQAFGLRATLCFALAASEYHTNVVLSILAGRAAVVHRGAIAGDALHESLRAVYGGSVLELTDEEKANFAGNCIAATPADVLISQRAMNHLRPTSIAFFADNGFKLHALDVSELERAGGSVRCMIAEIIAKRKLEDA